MSTTGSAVPNQALDLKASRLLCIRAILWTQLEAFPFYAGQSTGFSSGLGELTELRHITKLSLSPSDDMNIMMEEKLELSDTLVSLPADDKDPSTSGKSSTKKHSRTNTFGAPVADGTKIQIKGSGSEHARRGENEDIRYAHEINMRVPSASSSSLSPPRIRPMGDPNIIPWAQHVGVDAQKMHVMQTSLFRMEEEAAALKAASEATKPRKTNIRLIAGSEGATESMVVNLTETV
ncbi:hypothetical protein CPB84DRAFT_1848696 [Gymnopilus junonius]|uniref:Uncharacterized protein n=1 Tax=Gymnopilus junonius TaxID=109634 RepID=A0A9P5NMF7_GYMJU|nr:hypothetical protein CPB84DRAFT_1848696 [Gymnopilus junonius]